MQALRLFTTERNTISVLLSLLTVTFVGRSHIVMYIILCDSYILTEFVWMNSGLKVKCTESRSKVRWIMSDLEHELYALSRPPAGVVLVPNNGRQDPPQTEMIRRHADMIDDGTKNATHTTFSHTSSFTKCSITLKIHYSYRSTLHCRDGQPKYDTGARICVNKKWAEEV